LQLRPAARFVYLATFEFDAVEDKAESRKLAGTSQVGPHFDACCG
jgi:hypothetical protein